ncbi:hypothetical protein BYT27DRAFT_6935145 [Phlegmacium glaucopus]|nr:hypothetical protein BYT27DRAFT_6935145 [Phlegmacium glaucopus]
MQSRGISTIIILLDIKSLNTTQIEDFKQFVHQASGLTAVLWHSYTRSSYPQFWPPSQLHQPIEELVKTVDSAQKLLERKCEKKDWKRKMFVVLDHGKDKEYSRKLDSVAADMEKSHIVDINSSLLEVVKEQERTQLLVEASEQKMPYVEEDGYKGEYNHKRQNLNNRLKNLSDRHQILDKFRSLNEADEEVDRNGIVTTQALIAAEGALKYISDSGKKAEIKAAFLDLQIVESQYAVLAGFNEALIQSGFGYLEEIHVFCCVEIQVPDYTLLSKLGKVLTPYPGIIFTPSSGYKTPVFKDDGTIWDYDDLSLHRAETHSSSAIRAKEILHSELSTFTSLAESQPSIPVTTSSCSGGGGNDNHGGTEEDKSDGCSDDQNNDREGNNPDDSHKPDSNPEDPESGGNGDPSTPASGIFDIQAKLLKGTGNSSSSRPFQVLEISGKLVVQTTPGQLKPRRIQSKSHVKFTKLDLQTRQSLGPVYEQVFVGVEIDVRDEYTEIDVLQPLKTTASNQETKEIIAKKVTTGGTAAGSVAATPAVSFTGSRSKETSSSTEGTKHHLRITVEHSDGVVSWGFYVDDANERRTGIGFGKHRALPSANFEFYGAEDVGSPPPPPKHFDVLVKSCWSLISPHGESHTVSNSWLSWFKGPGMPSSDVPLYSNLCQLVILEVPSDLSQNTFC